MDKTGQVEVGVTPCALCGRTSETLLDGEGVCMSCYLKKRHQYQPMTTKLANQHTTEST